MRSTRPWTFWDWLRHRLYPVAPCMLPQVPDPAQWKDVITNQTLIGIPWKHRLRILISGVAIMDQRVLCQNEVGRAKIASTFYPIPPIWAMCKQDRDHFRALYKRFPNGTPDGGGEVEEPKDERQQA